MGVVLSQWFPLGRFHATRWNQNPFEDRFAEWPPSPWRFLRALAARWFQYQREMGDDDSSHARDCLLRQLADEQPSFYLPPLTGRHELRQYQPTGLDLQYKYRKHSERKKNVIDYSYRSVTTTLVRDAFRVLPPDDVLYWFWEKTRLEEQQRALLAELVRRIHYFGRAEAWTRFELRGEDGKLPSVNCVLRREPSDSRVPVLVPESTDKLIDVILARTGDSMISNRPVPPGTAWRYATLPDRPTVKPRVRPAREAKLHVVRYALDSTVLPLVTEMLPVAEAARRALMGIHGRLTEKNRVRGRSNVLSGKDERGQPLADHRHAYYLPTDEDGDGRIDHLTVYAAGGFGPDERRAFDRLRELRSGRDGEARHPLRLLLLGMGAFAEYGPGPLQASEVWVTATPYIATRYAKTRGRNRIDMSAPEARAAFLQDDLRVQLVAVRPDLASRGAPEVAIEPIWDDNHVFRVAARWRTIQFKRYRRKAGDDGGRRLAGAFRLIFRHPVRGPIALGFSSHFGMGLFAPDSGSSAKVR